MSTEAEQCILCIAKASDMSAGSLSQACRRLAHSVNHGLCTSQVCTDAFQSPGGDCTRTWPMGDVRQWEQGWTRECSIRGKHCKQVWGEQNCPWSWWGKAGGWSFAAPGHQWKGKGRGRGHLPISGSISPPSPAPPSKTPSPGVWPYRQGLW